MKTHLKCPNCGADREIFRNPVPTVDIIIECKAGSDRNGIVLIKRKNPPPGWALPGGFVDYGETLEEAAVREAKEETGLEVELIGQIHSYSKPDRDPRQHTISTIFAATATGYPQGADDALEASIFTPETFPQEIAFDHRQILEDYLRHRYWAG